MFVPVGGAGGQPAPFPMVLLKQCSADIIRSPPKDEYLIVCIVCRCCALYFSSWTMKEPPDIDYYEEKTLELPHSILCLSLFVLIRVVLHATTRGHCSTVSVFPEEVRRALARVAESEK